MLYQLSYAREASILAAPGGMATLVGRLFTQGWPRAYHARWEADPYRSRGGRSGPPRPALRYGVTMSLSA
jgi:hypothetical protein